MDNELAGAILGLFIQYPELSNRIESLEEKNFEELEHKILFNICLEVYESKGTIDRALVLSKIGEDKETANNFKELVLECAELATNPSAIDEYITLLKQKEQNRRVSNAVCDLVLNNSCTYEKVKNILDREKEIAAYSGTREKSVENFNRFITSFEKPKELIPTGFGAIDFKIKGLERGTFFIIGARPSTGKTTFALNIAAHQIKAKRSVLFFSLEMRAEMIFERLAANYLNLDYSAVQARKLEREDIEKVKSYVTELRDNKLFNIVDDSYNIENITAQIMEVKPDIVFVDFIQIVSTSKFFKDLRAKINHISEELKRVAKLTGCIVVALSQVTRGTENKIPTMSDLRESGALEQDGDYIIMLYRPYVADKSANIDEHETTVKFDKNKFGATGSFDYYFDGTHQRFTFSAYDIQ